MQFDHKCSISRDFLKTFCGQFFFQYSYETSKTNPSSAYCSCFLTSATAFVSLPFISCNRGVPKLQHQPSVFLLPRNETPPQPVFFTKEGTHRLFFPHQVIPSCPSLISRLLPVPRSQEQPLGC